MKVKDFIKLLDHLEDQSGSQIYDFDLAVVVQQTYKDGQPYEAFKTTNIAFMDASNKIINVLI